MEARFRFKLPGGNFSGDVLNFEFCLLNLQVAPRGAHRRIAFEVMESQALRTVSPRFTRRQRIDPQLQTVIGVLL